MNSINEIGSEFWNVELSGIRQISDRTYLSGRTALTAIILDLKCKGKKKVALPEYCCESMIEPFLRQGMEVCFYPVWRDESGLKFELETGNAYDAVLLVDFFGYMSEEMKEAVLQSQKQGKSVILDVTHAVFLENKTCDADYVFGSYRKWTAVEAGFVLGKYAANLNSWECNVTGKTYLALRNQARAIKTEFVTGDYVNEDQRRAQLSLFAKAEEYLDQEYLSDTDEENKRLIASLDSEYISKRRKENAKFIYGCLPQLKFCQPMFPRLSEDNVPLTVPILLTNGQRDSLRAYLRECGIFCPIHWPLTEMHIVGDGALKIYESELSLVCDQRYSITDMTFMMEKVRQWETIISV